MCLLSTFSVLWPSLLCRSHMDMVEITEEEDGVDFPLSGPRSNSRRQGDRTPSADATSCTDFLIDKVNDLSPASFRVLPAIDPFSFVLTSFWEAWFQCCGTVIPNARSSFLTPTACCPYLRLEYVSTRASIPD